MGYNALWLSKHADGIGLAIRLQERGEVRNKFYLESQELKSVGEGLVPRVPSWKPHLTWADLVICDMVGMGKLIPQISTAKLPLLGCSELADRLELDRSYQMQVFDILGIPIPPTEHFSSPSEAKNYSFPEAGAVIKPSGNKATGMTLVCRDKETFLWGLEQQSSGPLIVQERLVGVEISTEGWWNGEEFLPALWNHTFEEKRLFSGSYGPNTGCMGNVVTSVKRPERDLFVQELKKLSPLLKKSNYRGPIDLNCIATAEGIFALELTMRFGYDAIEALDTLFPMEEVLLSCAEGKLPSLTSRGQVAVALRIVRPPYPNGTGEIKMSGLPVFVNEKAWPHTYPTDLFREEGKLKWAAGDGCLLKLAVSGMRIERTIDQAYSLLSEVECLDMGVRLDIGERVERNMSLLQKWGYL